MAVGGFAVDGLGSGFNGKITVSVVITCIVAASSGLIFGYDIGISGTALTHGLQLEFICMVVGFQCLSPELVVMFLNDYA